MAVLLDANHLHRIEIDDWTNSLERTGVAIVGRIASQKAERTCQAVVTILLGSVVASAPNVDHDELGVVDTIVPHEGITKSLAGKHRRLTLHLLVHRHHRLHARDVTPRFHDAPINRHNSLVARVGRVFEQHGKGLSGRQIQPGEGVD